MAYDPKDYDGITYESEARQERERAEAEAQEDQGRRGSGLFLSTAPLSSERSGPAQGRFRFCA